MISWLRFGETPLHERYHERALAALAALRLRLQEIDTPSEPEDVVHILHMVAETIQVEMPNELGMEAYQSLLQQLPKHVLRLAALDVLRQHSYRTLPLPAEFLASTEVESWAVAKRWLPRMIDKWEADLAA